MWGGGGGEGRLSLRGFLPWRMLEIDFGGRGVQLLQMKYKHVPSLFHNFTDSFMSLVNYSGDGYTVDELRNCLRSSSGGEIEVQWHPTLEVQGSGLTKGVGEAFARYAQWIPSLATSMRIDPSRIAYMRTVFFLSGEEVGAITEGGDDRGRIFKIPTKLWS